MAAGEAASYHHEEQVPFQVAVYVRRTNRDRFAFSHVRHSTIKKLFPRSLSVRDLSACAGLRAANEQAYKTSPVLVLVTGDRAEFVSYASVVSKQKVFCRYDHAERADITEEQRLRPTFSELSRGYMGLSVQCTVAYFERGRASDWAIASVIPVLSDWLVIPRVMTAKQVEGIIKTYTHAARKCLTDSRFMAEERRFRESTLVAMAPRVALEYPPEDNKEPARDLD